MISAWDLIFYMLLPLVWIERRLKGKHRDFSQRFARDITDAVVTQDSRETVLIHGVSVGEINATRALVQALQTQRSDINIVVAASTSTGFMRAQELYGEQNISVLRYPLDLSSAVGRFLDAVRPSLVVSMELEVWPAITRICQSRNIPFVVANGRLSERSFRGYHRFRRWVMPMFSRVSCVLAQNETYAQRFRELGVADSHIHVVGSMKWDSAKIESRENISGREELAQQLGIQSDMPLAVIASTGPEEERMLLDAIADHPQAADVQWLFAPRKPERFAEVAALMPEDAGRRSIGKQGSHLFLLDTLGELRKAYSLASIALIGRSWNGRQYGSDPMEPAGLGLPLLIGPHHADFEDAVGVLQQSGALQISTTPVQDAIHLLGDQEKHTQASQAAQQCVSLHQGATQRHVDVFLRYLPHESSI